MEEQKAITKVIIVGSFIVSLVVFILARTSPHARSSILADVVGSLAVGLVVFLLLKVSTLPRKK